MITPIYVECENSQIDKEVKEIGELLREVERRTAFLKQKGPMLYAVPAPDNDCLRIGNIAVYGISSLREEELGALREMLESFTR